MSAESTIPSAAPKKSAASSRELPTDRIATADEKGRRIWLYPADVMGRFRNRRTIVSFVLIFAYLILPWITYDGRQAILLDLPQRRFSFFGLTLWAHDAPLLLFIVGGAVMSLAFVTAVWGRVWCGWACPQTVYVDGVFRRIERWIEGDSVSRRRLDAAAMSLDKFLKKALKWSLFTVLAMIISHSFLAYFVGTAKVMEMVRLPPLQNPSSFLFTLSLTALFLFDFGWFREQFCVIVCPYGRLQSVLMDDRTPVVSYDAKRGEPRRGQPALPGMPAGDCVNCYRCVQVCPTGIDIRRGTQMECIACTACIDACDEVMRRLDKPAGLIRHAAEKPTPVARSPRAWVYAAILLVIAGGLTFALLRREPVQMSIIRATGAPYQLVTDPSSGQVQVLNRFKLDLRNQEPKEISVEVELESEAAARGTVLLPARHVSRIPGGEARHTEIFVRFPKSSAPYGHARARLKLRADRYESEQEVRLVAPLR